MSTSLNEYFTEWVLHWMSTSMNEYFIEWVLHWRSTCPPRFLWGSDHVTCSTFKRKTLKSLGACILWSFFNNLTYYLSWPIFYNPIHGQVRASEPMIKSYSIIKRITLEYFIMLLASSDTSQTSGGSGVRSRNGKRAFTWLKFHRLLVIISKAKYRHKCLYHMTYSFLMRI